MTEQGPDSKSRRFYENIQSFNLGKKTAKVSHPLIVGFSYSNDDGISAPPKGYVNHIPKQPERKLGTKNGVKFQIPCRQPKEHLLLKW